MRLALCGVLADALLPPNHSNRRLQQSVRQQEKKLATDHSSHHDLLSKLREQAEAARISNEGEAPPFRFQAQPHTLPS